MKKTYINPTLEVIKIQTHQMLASSDPTLSGEYNGETPLSRKIEFDDEEY